MDRFTYTKPLNEPLTKFYECLQLIETLLDHGLLYPDPNDNNNIMVYRNEGNGSPEGWYRENIHNVARELLHDIDGQHFLRKELEDKGIEMQYVNILARAKYYLREGFEK